MCCCSICVLSVILKDAIYTISKQQAIGRNDVVFVDLVKNSLRNYFKWLGKLTQFNICGFYFFFVCILAEIAMIGQAYHSHVN